MPTLDTNVLLRWILGDVPDQAAAAERLLSSGVSCMVPDVAVVEMAHVLERVLLLPRTTVVHSVEMVLGVASIDVDRALWRSALDDYLAHPKLSIADTLLAAQARASGRTPLYTFDRLLANQVPDAELLS